MDCWLFILYLVWYSNLFCPWLYLFTCSLPEPPSLIPYFVPRVHLLCTRGCPPVQYQELFTCSVPRTSPLLFLPFLLFTWFCTCTDPLFCSCTSHMICTCTVHLYWTCNVHLFCTWTVYYCTSVLDYSSVLYLGCHLFCSWTVHLFCFSTVHLFCIRAMLFTYTCTVHLYLYCSPVMNLYCSPVPVLLTCYEPVYEALFACGCFPVLTVGEGKNLTPAGLQGGCEPFRETSPR